MSNLHELAHRIRSTALAMSTTNNKQTDEVRFAQLRTIVELADQMIEGLLLTNLGNLDTPAVQFEELTEWYHGESTMDIVPSARQSVRSAPSAPSWRAGKHNETVSMSSAGLPSQSLHQLFRTTSPQPNVVIEDFPSPELTFALLATTPNLTNSEQVELQQRYLSVKSPLALPMLDSKL